MCNMALTYSLSSNSYEGRYMYLSCTQIPDVASNSSTINWTLTVTGGSVKYYATGPTTVTINGTQVYYKAYTPWDSYAFPAAAGSTSGSIKVYHNDVGAASVSVSLSTAIYTSTVTTKNGTWALDSIPRQATITSAPNFNDENNPTITYSNPAGNNVGSLQACISFTGAAADIPYRDISKTGSSYTFSLTEAERNTLRNSIPNSNSRSVIFYVKTVIGGSTYYSTLTRTLTIVNANPVFSDGNVGYYDSNTSVTSITGNNAMIVRNKSNLMITYSAATAKKGSSIAQYSFTVNGVTKTSTASGGSVNFGAINSASNITVSAKAIDSRGNASSIVSKTITCYDYYAPSFTSFNAYRCNANGAATLNGTYIKWDYGIKYAPVNGKNTYSVKIYGTPSGSGSVTSSGAKVAANNDNTYNVYAIVTDSFGGSAQSLVDVVRGPVRVLNISSDGSNIAVGKIVEGHDSNGVFDCRWKIKTDDPANTMKNLSYRGSDVIKSTATDTTDNWGSMGNLATVFYTKTGELIDQPSQHGLLLNLTNGPDGWSEVHQLWATQANGSLLHRGGNGNGWSGTWRTILDSSNYTSYIATPSDYVVAQGTSGDFRYRKWNSGLSEAWYYKELGSLNLTVEKASGVWTNNTYQAVNVTLPSGLFIDDPIATGNIGSTGYTLFQISSVSPTTVAYRIWSSHSSNPNSCVVSMQLTGRWK